MNEKRMNGRRKYKRKKEKMNGKWKEEWERKERMNKKRIFLVKSEMRKNELKRMNKWKMQGRMIKQSKKE